MKQLLRNNAILLLFIFLFFVTATQTAVSQTAIQLPEGISLLWEADTYTPPFYKGKALYTSGADMRIIALPDERFGNPDNLFYEWSVNGKVMGSNSGKGVRAFTLNGSSLVSSPLIQVSARQTADGEVVASAGMRPNVVTPRIAVYETDPISGTLFQNELREQVEITKEEVVLSAYPYFFSIPSRGELQYEWSLNNNEVGNSFLLTLERGEQSGAGGLELDVTHPTELLQRGSQSLTLFF